MVDHTANTVNGPVHGTVVQAGHIYVGGSQPPAVPEGADAWVRAAAESRAWKHIREDRDAEPYRCVALKAVGELARLRDETVLAEDPWQDPGIAVRFASRVDWLLGDDRLDLYPAEAALLAVLPFLYRVRSLRLTAVRASVRPTDLARTPDPDPDRAAYEQFIESYDLLVGRTRTRPASAATLGWWLFHRWLDQHEDLADPEGVQEIVDQLPMLADLGETFALKRVCALLHGLRRGPDVGNRDYLAGLSTDDHLRAPGEQHVREPRLALLLALAYGTAIEMTALPEIVAEHLGIPHEVDLTELRRTLDEAAWGGPYDLPVLRAECHHEAVVEGLREYTARADELLHAVRRVLATHPLPTRLTSDEAAPAAGAFTGWARFRMDERRVRSLLMGVELYRDRDLAVRELYQNALDACRYRRARTEYLDRTNPIATFTYDGRIEFRQGVDENGRAYLECQDNGVGMGEEELRGVFSNAGARFAEQLDFKLERAEWRKVDPPVELYPNSRFGIGVLSYFMLADEIRVTTCRLDASGQLGPQLDVSIYGPSHLFRIAERAEQGRMPGTTVRLYLRDDIELGESWSCVDVLERLLAVAEFATSAVHDGVRECAWEPGVLKVRQAPPGETFGFSAWGLTTSWAGAPEGAQVTWCEQGGALLVDGLVVEPEVVRGVISPRGLSGVVLNLTGSLSPRRLSVDRRRVISDLSETVRGLLEPAVDEFVSGDSVVLSMEWIHQVTERNYHLADLVAAEVIRQGRPFEFRGVEYETRSTGCFLADEGILRWCEHPDRFLDGMLPGNPPDHVLLWRMMAHGLDRAFPELSSLCPELLRFRNVRPAMPSDIAVLAPRHQAFGARLWTLDQPDGEWVVDLGRSLGITLKQARDRAAGLGVLPARDFVFCLGPDRPPVVIPRQAAVALSGISVAAPVDTRVEDLEIGEQEIGELADLWRGDPVELTYDLIFMVGELGGESFREVIERIRACGADIPIVLPERPVRLDRELFSPDGAMDWDDLPLGAPVPFARLIDAARTLQLHARELARHLRSRGIVPSADDLPAGLTMEQAWDLLDLDRSGSIGSLWIEGMTLADLLKVSLRTGHPMARIIDWYRAWGIDVPDPAELIRDALARVPMADPS
ncbi:hypothetical protein ACFY4B_08240 [Kitasatospora sp. NPDC001261]|uniref:HD domain-containing protein n=1 Tax=Kitasatospora sp. NPDC001261 TaxID=3364012 RepID=UPI00369FD4F6